MLTDLLAGDGKDCGTYLQEIISLSSIYKPQWVSAYINDWLNKFYGFIWQLYLISSVGMTLASVRVVKTEYASTV